MSCNWIQNKKGEIVGVKTPTGEQSQLFKDLELEFGIEEAQEMYAVSRSSEFLDIFGDKKTEPSKETVVKYITTQNANKEPLTQEQTVDYINVLLGVENFSVDLFFDKNGIFTINSDKLKGVYSSYELEKLKGDIELQKQVKNAVEALKNTQELPDISASFPVVDKTYELNSFGKLNVVNPYIANKEIVEALAGYSEEEIEARVQDLDYPQTIKTVDTKALSENYVRAEVMFQEGDEILPKPVQDVKSVIKLKKVADDLALEQNIAFLIQTREDVLSNRQAETEVLLKDVQDRLIKQGLDVSGISSRPLDKQYLNALLEFVMNPTTEVVEAYTQEHIRFFEVNTEVKTEPLKIDKKDRELVLLNTNLSEEEVFKKQRLVKQSEGVYIKVGEQSLEELYDIMSTYTEKYPKDMTLQEFVQKNIKGFRNADIAEQVFLYKMYFDVLPNTVQIRNNKGQLLAPNGKISNLNEEQYNLVRTPEFKAWFGDWQNDPQNSSKVVDENGEPLVVYHGSPYSGITEFNREESVKNRSGIKEVGTYFATNKTLSEAYKNWSVLSEDTVKTIDIEIKKWRDVQYSSRNNRDFSTAEEEINKLLGLKKGKVYSAFLNLRKLKDFDAKGEENIEAWNNLEVKASYKWAKNRDAMEFLKDGKFGVEKVDGIHAKNIVDAFVQGNEKLKKDFLGDVYLVFDGNENMIKSATEIKGTTLLETNDIRFLKSVNKKAETFSGDYKYLTTEFASDFYLKYLKEKTKDSKLWKDFYKHFEFNEKGIKLKNDDVVTLAQIKVLADENLKEYSTISKQMPSLKEVSEEVSIPNKRDEVVNNPMSVKEHSGQVIKTKDGELILKNASEDFVRIGDTIYEKLEEDSNLSLYGQLEKNSSNFYKVGVEKPKAITTLSEYSHLNNETDNFSKVKKTETEENFECL